VSSAGDLTRSKNVVFVSDVGGGLWCITLDSSIDPSTTGLVVSPDFSEDDTTLDHNGVQTFAEFVSVPDNPNCLGDDQMEGRTGTRTPTTSGSPDADVHDEITSDAPEGFFFMVPCARNNRRHCHD